MDNRLSVATGEGCGETSVSTVGSLVGRQRVLECSGLTFALRAPPPYDVPA
jgi:hypothetical protein